MKRKANAVLFVISLLLLASATVAGCQKADVEQAAAVDDVERQEPPKIADAAQEETNSSKERDAVVRAGDGKVVAKSGGVEARAGDGKARAGNVVAGEGDEGGESGEGKGPGGSSYPGRVILKVGGEPGTEFSGTCAVGGREENLAGRVPGRFVYDLDGRNLECEVRGAEPSAGELEVSANSGGLRRKTIVRGQGDEVSFSLTERGTALSTFSSGSGGSVNQQTKVTSSSSSSKTSSSGSR